MWGRKDKKMSKQNELVLYTSGDGKVMLPVAVEQPTVFLRAFRSGDL